MITASPRLGTLLAGGAVLLAFGIAAPSMADSDGSGKPADGSVGRADDKAPGGQAADGSDPNRGYECDDNHGVGQGNPAHTGCDGVGYPGDPTTHN
jgi:hypothetical protein